MKLVPGGVSRKTGKPYNAFWVCQVKDCTFRPPAPETPPTAQNTGFKPASENQDEKVRSMAVAYAKDLVVAGKADIKEIGKWADAFVRYIKQTPKPVTKEPEPEAPEEGMPGDGVTATAVQAMMNEPLEVTKDDLPWN